MLLNTAKGLDDLKKHLQEAITKFSERKLDATLVFDTKPPIRSRAGSHLLGQGMVRVLGREDGFPLYIMKSGRFKDGYSIFILADDEPNIAQCGHIIHVPKGAEGKVKEWEVDHIAAQKCSRFMNDLSVRALIDDALTSRAGIKKHQQSSFILRRDGQRTHRSYYPVWERALDIR